jgi:TonB family protein
MSSPETMKWMLLAVLVCAATAASQTPSAAPEDKDETVIELGPGVTPPRVTHQVNPNPDSGSQGFRVSGTVLIGLIVSSQGLPRGVHVVRSLDKDLDRNAVDAVRQWRFEPARKSDRPVAVRVTVEINFRDL